MYEQSHRDYLLLVITIIVCLSWVIITVITPLPTTSQRDKNARELKLANAAIDMQMRQRDVAALDAKYTDLADAKAENDALRDVAAGRRRLHQSSLSVSA